MKAAHRLPSESGRETGDRRNYVVGCWPRGRDRAQQPIEQALIEPLSERELDVLRLLGKTGRPDIARELTVSLNTCGRTPRTLRQARVTNAGRGPPSQELDLLSRTRTGNPDPSFTTPGRSRPHRRPSSERPAQPR